MKKKLTTNEIYSYAVHLNKKGKLTEEKRKYAILYANGVFC